jgi:hypothetical protein
MKEHRNPRCTISNQPAVDNFNAADALELLHAELVEVEALAHAAGEAVAMLPPVPGKQRRTFERLYALVNQTAAEASTLLTLSEQLVSLLSAHMASRKPPLELKQGAR